MCLAEQHTHLPLGHPALQDRAAKEAQAASDAARVAAAQRLDYWLAPGIVVKVCAGWVQARLSLKCLSEPWCAKSTVLHGQIGGTAVVETVVILLKPEHLACQLPQVLAKKLADYYKKKGVVLRVVDKYVAEIEMSDSGDVLQVGGWVGGWVGRGRGPGGALGV